MRPYGLSPDTRTDTTDELREHIDQLNDLAWSLQHEDPERSRALATEAQRLAAGDDLANALYEDGMANSLLIQSVLEWDCSNYRVALALAFEAQALFEKTGNLRQQAFLLNHRASIHFLLGDYLRALEFGFEAIRLGEQSGDRGLQASLLNDTAYICAHMGQFAEALPQLFKSLAMHREVGSLHGEAQTLDSIGKTYYLMGDYEQALTYEQQSLTLNRSISYKRAETEALNNIGKIYAASDDLPQALEYFEQALAQAHERGYKQFEAGIMLDIARAFLASQRTDRALAYLAPALDLAEAIRAKPVVLEVHYSLADAYEQMGDHVKALTHYKQHHQIKEEVFNEKTASMLGSLQMIREAEQAKQEAELYHLKNVALQHEIEEREKLIEELDAFAHTVAHDLKSPLAIIVGYGELLKDEIAAGRYDNTSGIAHHLLETGYNTGRIVDELLLLASIRQDEIVLGTLNMAEIIKQVEKRLRNDISASGTEIIKPSEWPPALGYAPWIAEVWANYISNAIKYGGNPPRIELGANITDDGLVHFWVHDNGPGIDPASQDQLFTQFTRLDQMRAQGHGLGLSIVKRIIEKLDGSVSVESAGIPGQGCTFSFTLPAVPEPA